MSARTLRLVVPAEAAGSRLDLFLAARIPDRTRSALRRLVVDGSVLVDGRRPPKPGFSVEGGMRVEIALPAAEPERLVPERIPIEVVHEDDHLLAVVKPAGLVVHPGHGRRSGTLGHALLGRGTPLAPAGGADRPGIVHRLDRETSGLLLVAKTDEAHRALAAAFARRRVGKTYQALVWGHPDPAEGEIDRGIGRSRSDPTRMSTRSPRGRAAVTRYRTVERLPGFALLEVLLLTGRTHQIRVHLQSIHHPVVGDTRYGGAGARAIRDRSKREALERFDRLALHASDLALVHPITGEELRLHAPIPPQLRELLETLRTPA